MSVDVVLVSEDASVLEILRVIKAKEDAKAEGKVLTVKVIRQEKKE